MSCRDCYTVSPIHAPEINLSFPFGTTPAIRYVGKTLEEDPFDFTGKGFDFRVYNNKRESVDVANAIFSYATGAFTITDNAEGVAASVSNVIKLFIEDTELDLLSFSNKYYYRLQMIDSAESINLVLMRGEFVREKG